MNIAIIGANSFLAQSIFHKLKDQHRVFQVYHQNTFRIKFPNEDTLNIQDFLKLKPKIDVIFYVSSVIDFEENHSSLFNLFSTNTNLLKVISEKFASAKIINASSVSVHEITNEIINETSNICPRTSYAITKWWGEQIVNRHIGGGVNIRISSLFGTGMNQNTFLPKVIKDGVVKGKIKLFGDGSRKQNYIHVDECSEYFVTAIEKNISTPLLAVNRYSYSNKEIAKKISNQLGDVEIYYVGEDHSPGYIYNNSITRNTLGINLTVDFDKQLYDTISWMRK